MTTLRIDAGGGYHAYIGRGLIAQSGALLRRDAGLCRIAPVTDSNVEKIWLPPVQSALRAAGFTVCPYVFPAGERSKNLNTFSDLLALCPRCGFIEIRGAQDADPVRVGKQTDVGFYS